MTTKQRIIDQAIQSFNADGVVNVTLRKLAKSLGMSHGNLEYHYPTKEVLLLAIYQQMKFEISQVYEQTNDNDVMVQFNKLLLRLEAFHERYLFFNLDILEVSRNYEKVDELLKKTFHIRRHQMSHFYTQFIKMGYLKEEPRPGVYKRLQQSIRILITFWKSQQRVIPHQDLSQQKMSEFIWDLLIPHMTEKGINAYSKL